MVDPYKLKRIKMFDYPDCDYVTVKQMHFRSFNQYLAAGCTVVQCVNGHYYHGFDRLMDENGMDKMVAMICGMLFMMEHDDVEDDQAYGVNLDIQDFETGEYNDLFTPQDLELIKKDIQTIKVYLSQHPEQLHD